MLISGNNKHKCGKFVSASKHYAIKKERVMVAELHEFTTS
jgi:hypothetical protein